MLHRQFLIALKHCTFPRSNNFPMPSYPYPGPRTCSRLIQTKQMIFHLLFSSCFIGKFVITAACVDHFSICSSGYFIACCQRVMKNEKWDPNCVLYLREITSTSVYSIWLHQKLLITAFWSWEKWTTQYLTSALPLLSKNWSWQICSLLTRVDLQIHCSVKGETVAGEVGGSIEVAKWWYYFLNDLVPSSIILQTIP